MTYSIKMAVASASAMSASPVRSTEPPEIPEYIKEFERLFFRNIDNGRSDPENGSSLSEISNDSQYIDDAEEKLIKRTPPSDGRIIVTHAEIEEYTNNLAVRHSESIDDTR